MKKGISLFHYKYYKDQLPLRLGDAEMDDVMQGLKKVSPNGRSLEMVRKICLGIKEVVRSLLLLKEKTGCIVKVMRYALDYYSPICF